MVCCEMALGCSRLYPVPSYKSLRMETEQPLGQCIPLLDSLNGEKAFFPYIWFEFLLFQLMPIVFHPPAIDYCEEPWVHLLHSFLMGMGRLLFGPPSATSSPCWRILVPSAFPHWTSAPDWSSWWPSAELTPLHWCLEWPKAYVLL